MYKLRGTNWEASPHTLTKFYKAYIRPTLEYAAPILLCLTKTRKKRRQILQNKALKMALQAHHRTHIQTLHDQTNIELIETRLEYIAKKACTRVQHNPLFQETITLNQLLRTNNKRTLLDKIT